MTSAEGKGIIISGWRRAGILDAVAKGRANLASLDPFHDIDPLLDVPIILETTQLNEENFTSSYVSSMSTNDDDDEDDEDWIDEQGNVVANSMEVEDNEADE